MPTRLMRTDVAASDREPMLIIARAIHPDRDGNKGFTDAVRRQVTILKAGSETVWASHALHVPLLGMDYIRQAIKHKNTEIWKAGGSTIKSIEDRNTFVTRGARWLLEHVSSAQRPMTAVVEEATVFNGHKVSYIKLVLSPGSCDTDDAVASIDAIQGERIGAYRGVAGAQSLTDTMALPPFDNEPAVRIATERPPFSTEAAHEIAQQCTDALRGLPLTLEPAWTFDLNTD